MNDTNRPHRGELQGLDQLLLYLYRSSHGGAQAWSDFIGELCAQLQAGAAVLILRQPVRGDAGMAFAAVLDSSLQACVDSAPKAGDPFINLESGSVCALADRVDAGTLSKTEFYRTLLCNDDGVDMLALNIDFGTAYRAQLRIARRCDPVTASGESDDMQRPRARPFGILEKSLLMRIYPHMQVALDLFAATQQLQLENAAYVGAIDRLAFGTVVINERGHVVRVNETASIIMKESPLLRVVGHYLHAAEPDHEVVLAKTLEGLLAAPRDRASVAALKMETRRARPLYLLFKTIERDRHAGAASGVALFLSHEKVLGNVAIDTFARLYQLTRAETTLATELLAGASIAEAAAALGISEHTARSQLRSIFTKTDTHRQSDLVRLALTSLAIIG